MGLIVVMMLQDRHSSLGGLLVEPLHLTSPHDLGTVWWVGSKLLIANLAREAPLLAALYLGHLSKRASKEKSALQNSESNWFIMSALQ